ncbi:unnamed protein product [Nippostrongylus brasiliensis]|uniref:Uncharacterized protein n=1 Tax=Nippostrongylus brasiliensis TaxID=27835 RepID=A0A0N4YBT2_NIPBR|nr:unnamed protein product [Nippostrongylus brasiliensis]
MQKSEKSESKMKKRSSDTTIDAGSKESTTKFGSGEAAGETKCCGSSEGTGIIRCVESVESNPSIKCADPAKLAAGESARAPKVVEGADTYEQNDSKDSKELAAILSDRKSRKDVLLGTAEPLLPEDNTQPDDVEESAGGAQQVSEAPSANETPSKGEQAATETKSEVRFFSL